MINAVESNSIIETFTRQVDKRVDSQRGSFWVELKGHVAILGLDRGCIGLFSINHPRRANFHQTIFNLDHFNDGFDARGIPIVNRTTIDEHSWGGTQADAVGIVDPVLNFLRNFFANCIR